jgi:flagellar FliJ protein
MKRFRFNLEKVLELRQYREQEAKNELGKAIGILTAIENDIQTNAMVRARAVQERFSGIESGDDDGTFSMMTWDSYINRLEQEAQRLMEEAARAELVVEEKRAAYLDASREVKVMEKLKEKREGEYRKEMFATETRELDDMYRPRR